MHTMTNDTNYKIIFANETSIYIYEKIIETESASLKLIEFSNGVPCVK